MSFGLVTRGLFGGGGGGGSSTGAVKVQTVTATITSTTVLVGKISQTRLVGVLVEET